MIKSELKLPESERIDFVSITTPNNWHFPIARDFLKAGFHVMCEKPMTITSAEAKQLQSLVKSTGMVFGLMHNYTGYPMVKLAKDMVKGRYRRDSQGRCAVSAGVAGDGFGKDRQYAGGLANRPQTKRRRRLRRRYRNSRRKSR